ncbi:ficolin-3-like [Patiria miniata]|uniref:Fibrinogen C-terminal domain-containing protein n=1 Tax=Patiria miniata TaxID=46514 RepID=A0A914AYX4_PATMI|nr:ficolin-3-like [Patiria miniata]
METQMFHMVYVISLGALTAAFGFEHSCAAGLETRTFYAAENRALRGFTYLNKTARSAIICGRECSMDLHCRSFNFDEGTKLCEINQATRNEHPGNFSATLGSLYYDGDEDTPLYSLSDCSLSRYRSCKMLLDAGYRSSGVYTINPEGFGNGGLRVYCDMETDGGGWIVFQRRQDGGVDFYRNWAAYQSGFGELSGEFWLGNDNLVTLTSDDSQGTWELRVDLEDWDNKTAWARYTDFKLSPGKYNLIYDKYDNKSTAGDSLEYSKGFPFTALDADNDNWQYNCAHYHRGAWWFNSCLRSHLNGKYYPSQHANDDWGISWRTSHNRPYSMKRCGMKIREAGLN